MPQVAEAESAGFETPIAELTSFSASLPFDAARNLRSAEDIAHALLEPSDSAQNILFALTGRTAAELERIKVIFNNAYSQYGGTLIAALQRFPGSANRRLFERLCKGYSAESLAYEIHQQMTKWIRSEENALALLAGASSGQRAEVLAKFRFDSMLAVASAEPFAHIGQPTKAALRALSLPFDGFEIAVTVKYCLEASRAELSELPVTEQFNHHAASQALFFLLESPWTKTERATIEAEYRGLYAASLLADLQKSSAPDRLRTAAAEFSRCYRRQNSEG